jgi:hypothetical protein
MTMNQLKEFQYFVLDREHYWLENEKFCSSNNRVKLKRTTPAWAGFKTADEERAKIMLIYFISVILSKLKFRSSII